MASQEEGKLNFYSKYNRVRDKQEIDTLYMLIDDKQYFLNHFDNLVLTLNCSRTSETNNHSPIKNYNLDSKNRKQKSNSFVPMFEEQEKNDKFREMQQKLRKLQQLQRNFHAGLERTEKEYQRKKQLKETRRRQREYYQNQLINVVQQISEHSQQSHNRSIPYRDNIVSSQIIDDQDLPQEFDDYMQGEVQINDQNESDCEVKETKRKLKQILEMQKQRQKQVQSVEQNNEGKTSSIVIERMSIMPKINQNLRRSILIGANTYSKQPKPTNNLYSLELAHSQSENMFSNIKEAQMNESDMEANKNQAKYKDSADGSSNNQRKYQEEQQRHQQVEGEEQMEGKYKQAQQYQPNQSYDHQFQQQFDSNNEMHHDYQQMDGQANTSQQLYAVSDHYQGQIPNYNYYQDHNEIDPPITLAQDEYNHFGVEDTSQINEEINDHVVSIGDLSQQQSQPPNPQGNARSPLFLSQTSPRKTFQNQHQVQSIAESLDFHPLENQHSAQKTSKSNIIHGQKEDKSKQQFKVDGDRKNSFKKLMAENRSNLIPRLAISTILNEHINEVLGDYRANQAPVMATNLHESIISSQANSTSKPGKINFKDMLRRNKKNPGSGRDKTVINKDPQKVQNNKKLLMTFFDQN